MQMLEILFIEKTTSPEGLAIFYYWCPLNVFNPSL